MDRDINGMTTDELLKHETDLKLQIKALVVRRGSINELVWKADNAMLNDKLEATQAEIELRERVV